MSEDHSFTIEQGERDHEVGAIALDPLVLLGAILKEGTPGPTTSYDLTLWLAGESDALAKVKSATYRLPAPFRTPNARGRPTIDFCFRETGTAPFQDLGGQPVEAAIESTTEPTERWRTPSHAVADRRPAR